MNYYRLEYNPTAPNFTSFGGYNPAHGILIMQNCTLKNVRPLSGGTAYGIESFWGGILELYDNYFENNETSIFINTYDKSSKEIENANAFNIINCTFNWIDDSEVGMSAYKQHIFLKDCRRVQIEGCTFFNDFAKITGGGATFKDRHVGITLDNASFVIQKSGFNRRQDNLDSSTYDRLDRITKCPQYTAYTSKRNKFLDLTYGIAPADGVSALRGEKSGISDCVFYNCHYGMDLLSDNNQGKIVIAKNGYILNQSHKFPTVRTEITNESPCFILLRRVADFTISENAGTCNVDKINNDTFTLYFVQIQDQIRQEIKGEIYRNNVDILDVNDALYINGFNCLGMRDLTHETYGVRIRSLLKPSTRVYVTCNKFNNIHHPIRLNGSATKQANLTTSAARTLAATNAFINCGNPRLEVTTNQEYIYDGVDDDPDPSNTLTKVVETSSNDNYECKSLGCQEWPTKYIDPSKVTYQLSDQQFFSFYVNNKQLVVRNEHKDALTILVVSITGKVLYQGQSDLGETFINLREDAQGLYIIHVVSKNKFTDSQKFILY